MRKKTGWMALVLACALLISGCSSNAEERTAPKDVDGQTVQWPKEKLKHGEDGVPLLRVYVTADKKTRQMDLESYVEGVLAGEMRNDWPPEALKAQAILARTFVLKFIEEKESRYPDSDISTDIEEAQAYSAADVNDSIRRAVRETRGKVLVWGDGQLPYAWFHAHSGGRTELAKAGLSWEKAEPAYTQSVPGNEPDAENGGRALREAAEWEASFPFEAFEAACAGQGVQLTLTQDSRLSIAQRGESGRAVRLEADGNSINASSLRIALGSTRMRSTLLTSLKTIENGRVYMAGKGYGHGVGMSQWGAYGMAQEGRSAEEIVTHYFANVTVKKLW